MKKFLDKSFVFTLIVLDAMAILIGMVSGPFGYESLSVGASLSAAVISFVILVFGIVNWKRR